MEPWTIWLITAILLLIVEVLTQMMWALCLTAGALGAMVCSLAGVAPVWQFVAMTVVGLCTYVIALPKFKRWHSKSTSAKARTGMDALIGRRATVTQDIHPDSLGRARIDGDSWQVKAPGVSETLRAGSIVTVTAYDSNILTVEPA